MIAVLKNESITGRDGYIMARALYVASKALRSKEIPEYSNADDMEALLDAWFPAERDAYRILDRMKEGVRLGLRMPEGGLTMTVESVEAWITAGIAARSQIADAREALKERFESALEWRSQKLARHPHDERNGAAIEHFRMMLDTLDFVLDTTIRRLDDEYSLHAAEGAVAFHEKLTEQLRSIGFHSFPADAQAFCDELLSSMR